jgi:hypothetical protein
MQTATPTSPTEPPIGDGEKDSADTQSPISEQLLLDLWAARWGREWIPAFEVRSWLYNLSEKDYSLSQLLLLNSSVIETATPYSVSPQTIYTTHYRLKE